MNIKFQTKEESKKEQLAAFLKLTPSERVIHFYRLMERLKDFPTQKTIKNNFEIIIHEK